MVLLDGKKQYVLMHKNVPVANIDLDEGTCVILAVGSAYAEQHVPVGVPVKNGVIDRTALNEWWRGRAIPASRAGLKHVLMELRLYSAEALLEQCLGLSLSDQYWICPIDSSVQWSDVNFFENSFSADIGNILFGQQLSGKHINLMSPDNSSDGWLKKKWKIINGRRCLMKGGSGAFQQETYNEVIASCIMRRLSIPHVGYSLLIENDQPYSICEDFITPQTELISAWSIMKTLKKPNHVSAYHHYIRCCEVMGVPGIREAVDRMLVLDYLIVNEDRHLNNFGVIRNAETLKYIGAAPIFDSGTSLWLNKPTPLVKAGAKIESKPFKSSHEEQIKLVSSFDWLDLTALEGVDEEVREIVQGSVFIDESRCEAICAALQGRIERLKRIIDSRSDDILKNMSLTLHSK